jgi:hypothetical protein
MWLERLGDAPCHPACLAGAGRTMPLHGVQADVERAQGQGWATRPSAETTA